MSSTVLSNRLAELNGKLPSCWISEKQLRVSDKTHVVEADRRACVFLPCCHVQSVAQWKFDKTCPDCETPADHCIFLSASLVPIYHLDDGRFEYCFNPCGHVASRKTVLFWSDFNNSPNPECPFCKTPLVNGQAYAKLMLQDVESTTSSKNDNIRGHEFEIFDSKQWKILSVIGFVVCGIFTVLKFVH